MDETVAPTAKKPRLQMPDEYLPPNNVLFVQNLPEGTTQEDLREVFEQHAGLVEIRTIAAKRDIAFVEYADEATATVAKDALHNFKIDGETKMKVSCADDIELTIRSRMRGSRYRHAMHACHCLSVLVHGGRGASEMRVDTRGVADRGKLYCGAAPLCIYAHGSLKLSQSCI